MHVKSLSPFLKHKCKSRISSNANVVFISLLCLNFIRASWTAPNFQTPLKSKIPTTTHICKSTGVLLGCRYLILSGITILRTEVCTMTSQSQVIAGPSWTNSEFFLYLQQCGGSSYAIGFSSIQNILGLSRISPQDLPLPKLMLLPVYVLNSQPPPVSVQV